MFWFPQALISNGLLTLPDALTSFLQSPFNPAAFGPAVAAFTLSYLNHGKTGVKTLLRKFHLRFGKTWLLPIFLTHPAIAGASLLLAVVSGDSLPVFDAVSNPVFVAVAFVYIFFLGGPFQEEWGWRGYALERLQNRWNALMSSLMLGIVWGLWHTPLFLIPGTMQSQQPWWGFAILIVSGSILFTWIYNNTNQSILAAMLFHTMNNITFVIIPTLQTTFGGLYLLITSVVVAAAITLHANLQH
ncbi:MAG: CPBP family intramembrane metalloprotease [Thaumarchaeota archaeon]|nr:CPBP family intramembrane metalloprotease [Candidatus Calditenuaceae archaeon]MDW8186657.1 CPBP family intramembrane glutamic endopeptidase [Nitrososphaerota archaeon]